MLREGGSPSRPVGFASAGLDGVRFHVADFLHVGWQLVKNHDSFVKKITYNLFMHLRLDFLDLGKKKGRLVILSITCLPVILLSC